MSEHGHTYIEGMDMSGKDSVAEIIARDLKITNIQKLTLVEPNPFNVDKKKIVVPDDLLFGVYLARSIIYDYENWNPLIVQQMQVSFTGVRSASYRAGFPDGLGPVFEELLKYAPLMENAFLLTASVEARKERMAKRGSATSRHDQLILTDPDKVARMDESILNMAGKMMGATVIDTSNLDQEEVAKIIRNIIKGLIPREQLIGVRLTQKNIAPDKKYFEKELDRYYDFIVRKKKVPS